MKPFIFGDTKTCISRETRPCIFCEIQKRKKKINLAQIGQVMQWTYRVAVHFIRAVFASLFTCNVSLIIIRSGRGL